MTPRLMGLPWTHDALPFWRRGLFVVFSVAVVGAASQNGASSRVRVAVELARPRILAWTFCGAQMWDFPETALADMLRPKLDLRSQPFAVEVWEEENWPELPEVSLSQNPEAFLFEGLLVIGAPGGLAEKGLLHMLSMYTQRGWPWPRLFLVPLGAYLLERPDRERFYGYEKVFSCFEPEGFNVPQNVVNYCSRLSSEARQHVMSALGSDHAWRRAGAIRFFRLLFGSPDLATALSSAIADAFRSAHIENPENGKRSPEHTVSSAFTASKSMPRTNFHMISRNTQGEEGVFQGLYSRASCCDKEGAFNFEMDQADKPYDQTIKSQEPGLESQDQLQVAGQIRVRGLPVGTDSRPCAVTFPLGVIFGSFDDYIFAHYVLDSLFNLQDTIEQMGVTRGHPFEADEILLLRWSPHVGFNLHNVSRSFLYPWTQMISALAPNVSVGDVMVRSKQGSRVCFDHLVVGTTPMNELRVDAPNSHAFRVEEQQAWRWRRVLSRWVSRIATLATPATPLMQSSQLRGVRVVLFSRAAMLTRRVLNEEQLVSHIKGRRSVVNVELVVPEKQSFMIVLARLRVSSLVITPEGGALSNAVFCRPRTPILVLLPGFKPPPSNPAPGETPRYPRNAPVCSGAWAALELHLVIWRNPNAPLCPADWDDDCHDGQYSSFSVNLQAFEAAWRYTSRLRGQTVSSELHVHHLYDD